jgi:anti-sigma factor RsiW
MSCTAFDLKAYTLGEVAQRDRKAVEDHVRGCERCREEMERLRLTRTALLSLEAEEIPQRIAFVSDQVFEPRWWQTMWRSGPAMGFAASALLAAAILVHAFARPVAPVAGSSLDTAQIEQRVERQVNARLDAAVIKAVAEAQARQSAEFAKVLNAVELQRRSDLATFQQTAEYYEKQVHRFEVASNEGPAQ